MLMTYSTSHALPHTLPKAEHEHIEHIEHIEHSDSTTSDYEVEYVEYVEVDEISDSESESSSVCSVPDTCATSVTDLDEDYMSPEAVLELANTKGKLVVVIDSAVYDLSEYRAQNALAQMVLKSLNGSDASWQFWRMNGRQQWEEIQKFRIGASTGIKPKYSPPQERFFSLRRAY
ncbi:hypothetical protein CJU89_3359 [Yarrowia sp. B02]|nr:hypothetical protein CJU89_3359 [Yarrowia sp. B02]